MSFIGKCFFLPKENVLPEALQKKKKKKKKKKSWIHTR